MLEVVIKVHGSLNGATLLCFVQHRCKGTVLKTVKHRMFFVTKLKLALLLYDSPHA